MFDSECPKLDLNKFKVTKCDPKAIKSSFVRRRVTADYVPK